MEERDELSVAALEPADEQHLTAVVRQRIDIADTRAERKALVGHLLGFGETTRTDGDHRLEHLTDVGDGTTTNDLIARPQRSQIALGARITSEEPIDRPPTQADDSENRLVGLSGDVDHLGGDHQPFVLVVWSDQQVVEQRQRLGQRPRISVAPGLVDDGAQFVVGVTAVEGLRCGDARSQAQAERAVVGGQASQRSSLQSRRLAASIGSAYVVDPQSGHHERGTGEQDRVVRSIGRRCRCRSFGACGVKLAGGEESLGTLYLACERAPTVIDAALSWRHGRSPSRELARTPTAFVVRRSQVATSTAHDVP